jgi:hypothetical protein
MEHKYMYTSWTYLGPVSEDFGLKGAVFCDIAEAGGGWKLSLPPPCGMDDVPSSTIVFLCSGPPRLSHYCGQGSVLSKPPLFLTQHCGTRLSDWEFGPKVSWCGETLSSATRKALVPSKGWFKWPAGNRGRSMLRRSAEAVSATSIA